MKHEDLIQKMTLIEKCAILQGGTAFASWPDERLGIPVMAFSDGPNGVRHQAGEGDHLGLAASEPATCFPTAVTVANTWDTELAELEGKTMGEEAAVQGVGTLLGPGLCIKRNPRCGRNFEYYSEDPYVAGKMASAVVRGIQSNGISACPKHYAVNSQETRRQASDSIIDERTLREIYLSAFETVVKEADPKTIMTSYNLVNGTYVNENEHLMVDVLRNEWGYEGAVVTDWGGSNDHTEGVRVGSTFEMPAPGMDSIRELMKAVEEGRLSEDVINERADEAIDLILSTAPAVANAADSFDVDAHHAVARQIAAEGAVLLKNDGILPLAPQTKVAVVGDFAETPRYQGAGSSAVNSTKVDSVVGLVGQTPLDYVGYAAGFERLEGENATKHDEAVDLARRADVVVMCLALDEIAESEGADRTEANMRLHQNQVTLLHDIAAVNPNVVVLLSAGSAIETPWLDDTRALLYCALGGQAGAGAALDIVCGTVNPSGKLTETWAKRYADVPSADIFPSDEKLAEYREGIYVGYRYYQAAKVEVAFPFGYGLSYTTFDYSDLTATKGSVSFTVTNTGSVAGAEVAQLYVAKPDHEVFRPVQELKGFARVELAPGESQQVTIDLDDRAYSYYNVQTSAWEVEGGTYELRVGASSEDIRLVGTVELAGTNAPNPYAGVQAIAPYETADVTNVSDESFQALLGPIVPDEGPKISRNMCFRDLNHGRSPLFWLVWWVLKTLKESSEKKGEPNLSVLFIWNMPLRALAKNAGPFVNMRMVDSIVMEVRGFWIIGILRLIVEFVVNLIQNAMTSSKLSSASKA